MCVQRALRRFTSTETLRFGEEYDCGGCNRKVRAEKQLTIHTPPLILMLHLKRFRKGGGKLVDSRPTHTRCLPVGL